MRGPHSPCASLHSRIESSIPTLACPTIPPAVSFFSTTFPSNALTRNCRNLTASFTLIPGVTLRRHTATEVRRTGPVAVAGYSGGTACFPASLHQTGYLRWWHPMLYGVDKSLVWQRNERRAPRGRVTRRSRGFWL